MKDVNYQDILIFPQWIRKFSNEPEIASLLSRLRDIQAHRARGNHKLPTLQLTESFQFYYSLYVQLRRSEENRQDLPLDRSYKAHRLCLEVFTPVAHRTFWSRWIYLERALEVASQTGDLLFGAIVLRTMAEDVWAIAELTRLESQLKHSGDIGLEDWNQIRSYGDLLWTRFLPPNENLVELPGHNLPTPFERPEYASLKRVFQNLNDYVHPNYGSHLLALFPEKTQSLKVILDAYVAIYERFFDIPWVEERLQEPLVELPPISIRKWQQEIAYLQNSILPEIQQHRSSRGLSGSSDDPAPHLRYWLQLLLLLEEESNTNLVWQHVPHWFDPLQSLAEFILGHQSTARDMFAGLRSAHGFGVSLPLVNMMNFASARRCAEELEHLFQTGRPSPEYESLRWFAFCQKALEVMLVITQHKIDVIFWALVRQLNDRNPVGSVLAMRSLIEHYAVAVWLGERLDKAWRDVEKQAPSGKLPIEQFMEIENEIARFLVGTKGSQEDSTEWKKEWKRLGMDKAVNLRSATERGIAREDVFGFLYKFGSDVIHGRKARGIELCPPIDSTYVRANLSRALVVLDEMSCPHRQLDIIAQAVSVLRRVESLATALSQPDINWEKVIRVVLSQTQQFKEGTHYTGRGTLEDPFVFAPGLEYYNSFNKLCKQLGLDSGKRVLVVTQDHRFLDAVPSSEGEIYYFAPPIPL